MLTCPPSGIVRAMATLEAAPGVGVTEGAPLDPGVADGPADGAGVALGRGVGVGVGVGVGEGAGSARTSSPSTVAWIR
jgi:hypothetical protein